MDENYKRSYYTRPTEKCPYCDAPLVAMSAADGPFQVDKLDDDGEKHTVEVYGSEMWACGTKRIGVVGVAKGYGSSYNRPQRSTRSGECHANQNQELDRENTKIRCERDSARRDLETRTKELAEAIKERDTHKQYREALAESVQRREAAFEKHAKMCAQCHGSVCEARETPEGIRHFCTHCGRQVTHILRTASGGPQPVEEDDASF